MGRPRAADPLTRSGLTIPSSLMAALESEAAKNGISRNRAMIVAIAQYVGHPTSKTPAA